ncbi:alpha/beta fold hydrolase [Synechococcus sp. M16CYN]|uniref:alpha/beta fold hydrolase n=1 Tax=Synechococcus sp. M16CYN TaxID=3103139 RepID=UPI003248FFC6
MLDRVHRLSDDSQLLKRLGVALFQERFPWIGGDLQTLRDTIHPVTLPKENGQRILIDVPTLPTGAAKDGKLLAFLDQPDQAPRGLVLLLHGLGGSSSREGLRRMGLRLQSAGFAVLRLNLRGADPGRKLAGGTYAARCDSDLIPVIARARELAGDRPLLGAGISLGGTMLLNVCLSYPKSLDGLFCASSPLDLADCSASIERPRNVIYQRWLLKRLIRQTLADPFGLSVQEMRQLSGKNAVPRTIRAFDNIVTAPRWGFGDVETYYREASPLNRLVADQYKMPPTLLLQALDDPWVPAMAALHLSDATSKTSPVGLQFTRRGGHNGFHSRGGCWGDQLAAAWLGHIVER